MADEKRCTQCGAVLAADAPQGLCPACLLKRGLESGSAPGESAPPPTPADLARFFPELEILELIGRGGMGAVYKARQKRLERFVALKVLPASVKRDPAFAERFAREARALARLAHPNIVAVHEFGQKEGLFYFVMEFVDGMNLRQLLNTGKIAPKEALAIVPQICDALQYAHDKGIVHRDIKPENILLDKAGTVKIADFGLAKLVGLEAKDLRITGSGDVMGTPHYMAPEQVEHPQDVDHRADIYSLGVVFYQMLTGELPIGRFAPPSRKVQIDVRLDEVVLRALEKEPEHRYQHVSELKTQVETIVTTPAGVPTSVGPVGQPPEGGTPTLVKSERGCLTVQEFPGAKVKYPWPGKLSLHVDRLVISSFFQQRIIPLADIRGLGEGVILYPAGHRFAGVDFDEGGQRRKLAFKPSASFFSKLSNSRPHSAEWLATIQRAVKSATGKELAINDEPTVMRVRSFWSWLVIMLPLLTIFGMLLVTKLRGSSTSSVMGMLVLIWPVLVLLPILYWPSRTWLTVLTRRWRQVVIGLIVAAILRVYFVQPFRAATDAAAPEIPRGSHFLVWKLSHNFAPGDLIAYRHDGWVSVGRVVRNEGGVISVNRNGEADAIIPLDAILGEVISVYWRASSGTSPAIATRRTPVFGPVTERLITAGQDGRSFFSFDRDDYVPGPTGFDPFDEKNQAELWKWMTANRVDVFGRTRDGRPVLMRSEMVTRDLNEDAFDRLTPAQLAEDPRLNSAVNAQFQAQESSTLSRANLLGRSDTLAFQTRYGAIGLVQFVGVTSDPPGVKIRYKLLQSGGAQNLPAMSAVHDWLALMDTGAYPQSWETAANSFHKAMTKEAWVKVSEEVRQPLGLLTSRKEISAQPSPIVPGMPHGSYFVAQFETSFAALSNAVETVEFMQEKDGQWKAISYLIRPRTAEQTAAVAAAQRWLAGIDAGHYAESWTDGAKLFRSAITQDKWVAVLETLRLPLVKVEIRTVHSTETPFHLPDAPIEKYVVVRFSAAFVGLNPATETVTLVQENDGQWKAIGYRIK